MPAERTEAITKELSRNDTGETGGHQAGILIPREPAILAFFPPLSPKEKNPRHPLHFTDDTGAKWLFAFIHYNNRLFGGTRNEYRLTCMTPYIRSANLKAGDTVTLRRTGTLYQISYKRVKEQPTTGRLKLGSTWRIVEIR